MKKLAGLMLWWLQGSLALAAQTPPECEWLQFDRPPVSPVARPTDTFVSYLNNFLCAPGYAQRLEMNETAGGLSWRVQATAAEPGWATLRFGLPPSAARDIAGVRVQYRLPGTAALKLDLTGYTGGLVDGRVSFYRAKPLGKRATVTLAPGEGEFYIDCGSFAGQPVAPVSGVGLGQAQGDTELIFRAVKLAFVSEAARSAFMQAEQERLEKARRTMAQWVADRGLVLPPADKLDAAYEARLWQGAWYLGLREELDAWGRLAAAHNQEFAAAEFQARLAQIAATLSGGGEAAKELGELQAAADAAVDRCRAALPPAQRRWRMADGRFWRPDGRPYRFYGAHFFRSLYAPQNPVMLWRPWDMRYLAALGFNGLRLQVVWSKLEPEPGHFDPDYLAMLLAICAEAERYGVGVSVDFHWPFPDWFVNGKPGCELPNQKLHKAYAAAYHWPEALVDAWGRLAQALADTPNLVACEVPTNEPKMASLEGGVLAYPNLNRLWNQYLKEKYATRAALAQAWGQAESDPARYALAADEDWDQFCIRPLGYQHDPSPQAAYTWSPRVWDHLLWSAWMQTNLTDACMQAIRRSLPQAVGMMQRTIGDIWDQSPIRIDYNGIQTVFGENVLPGTHYGVGGLSARKAASLTLASYDSEQQMENNRHVEDHLRLGLGFTAFAFHHRGGGGMLFSDDEWHLKPEVAHLPKLAAWGRTFWPEPRPDAVKLALIENTRLACTTGDKLGDLPERLTAAGYAVGVFEGLRVVKTPEVLDGYAAVITCSSYMDRDLLAVLHERFPGQVLLYGDLYFDAYARGQEQGLGGALRDREILLRSLPERPSSEELNQIDLAGNWAFHFVGPDSAVPGETWPAAIGQLPPDQWQQRAVPGYWGEVGLLGSQTFLLGDAWQQTTVVLPRKWQGRSLCLRLGAVDDQDVTFFNGRRIGRTTHHLAYLSQRDYPIPAELVKWGEANTLSVWVRNTYRDGGIWKGPVEIVSQPDAEVKLELGPEPAAPQALQFSPQLARVKPEMLRSSAQIRGRIASGTHQDCVALAQDGRWFWWLGDRPWTKADPAQSAVLAYFLTAAAPGAVPAEIRPPAANP